MPETRVKEATALHLVLPDFSDRKAVTAFVHTLRTHIHRHGVRHLLRQCERIMRYQHLQAASLRRAQAALYVVNGTRTPLQLAKDHERKWRNTATKFYSGMTDTVLYTHGKAALAFNPSVLNITRDELIAQLVERYIDEQRYASSEYCITNKKV